jgi:hypothetical protein
MVDVMDFRQEARGCLRLAESETQAELKTILMGMALGWLTLANQTKAPLDPYDEPEGEFAEEPVDEPVHA